MSKNHLTLYIDTDIVSLAKSSGLNLSSEFEEWIKIRLGKMDEIKPDIDVDLEIARHKAEILKLESVNELKKEKLEAETAEKVSLDRMIDNMIEFKDDMSNISEPRINGVQFIFKRRYNKVLNPMEAKELLLNRIKERNLNG